VTCFDKNRARIDGFADRKMPIYEPGLGDLVRRNAEASRLQFTADLDRALAGAEAIFIAVGTPARHGDGGADLTSVYTVAEAIGARLRGPCVVVCKSTVPVGTNRQVLRILRMGAPLVRVEVASNPEFLREGSAIEDFTRPDRIVVGVESDLARETLAEIYRPLGLSEKQLLFTDIETAELIKYAANSFLATKITFINEIADLCERVGADVQELARGLGLDPRIGAKFLQAGPGYGGSCLPKDTQALVQTARRAGVRLSLVEAVVAANAARKSQIATRIIAMLGGSVADLSIAVLGVTFKPNTDDVREAPALTIIPALQAAGAKIRAHDPEGMNEARRHLADVAWTDGPLAAAAQADAVVILTEWDAYRSLSLIELKKAMRGTALFDFRNVYRAADVRAAGLDYFGIGTRAGALASAVREAAE
jgi:UDPglucose 6-dehydrogenase